MSNAPNIGVEKLQNINDLVLHSRRIIAVASVELRLHSTRYFCRYLNPFVLCVTLGICCKFRAPCYGKPVDVLDDASQVTG